MTLDEEQRKRAVFDGMSARRQRYILKRGYDIWDPFALPKEPIDLQRDVTGNTAIELVSEFLTSNTARPLCEAYRQGVLEICLGIVRGEDRYRGMYEFACWYKDVCEGAKEK